MLASTRQPHSQGLASVQAHCTGGVTGSEGQEGANGVGGGVGVGAGNRDGNGDVSGHGDGARTGTGVEVNEGAQNGDEAGAGTRRRIPHGNEDDDNRNKNRIVEGGREAKKRKKPQNSCVNAVRETGETRVEREKNVEKKGLVQWLPTQII